MSDPATTSPSSAAPGGDLPAPTGTPSPEAFGELDKIMKDSGLGGEIDTGKGAPPASSTPKEPSTPPATPPATPPSSPPATPPKGPAAATPPAPPATPPKPGTPPATPPAAPVEPKDPELDAIEQPKGLNPTNAGNWQRLRIAAKQYKTQATEAQAKLKEVEEKLKAASNPVIPPEVMKELEDHRAFKRTFAIADDPEFKAKYDSVIESNDKEICGILKSCGMKPEAADALLKNGLTKLPWKYWEDPTSEVDADGNETGVPKGVLNKLKASDNPEENAAAQIIEGKLRASMQLSYEKKQAVAKASEGQSEFLKEREKKAKEQFEADMKTMKDRVDAVTANIPWAKPREIPADATPEQKAEIEAHNAFYKETEERFKIALFPRTALQRADTALAACYAYHLDRELKKSQSEAQWYKTEYEKLKGASRTVPSAATPPPSASKTKGMGDLLKMKDLDAISQGLEDAGA